jgi:hypothetical protein
MSAKIAVVTRTEPTRLAEDHLDDPGVLAVLVRPPRRHRRRRDLVEPDDGAFRFRHYFLRDDEDVATIDAPALATDGVTDQPGDIGVARHLGNAVNGEDVQIH